MNWSELQAVGALGTFALMLLTAVAGWVWKVHSTQNQAQAHFESEVGRIDEQHRSISGRLTGQEAMSAIHAAEIRQVRESQIRMEEVVKHVAATVERVANKLGVLP